MPERLDTEEDPPSQDWQESQSRWLWLRFPREGKVRVCKIDSKLHGCISDLFHLELSIGLVFFSNDAKSRLFRKDRFSTDGNG